jgi:hypothetical protein
MVNVQRREKAETRVARAIYACGIPFNMVWSPYLQVMIRAIDIVPQVFKGPNYEKLQTNLLKKERSLLRII